MTSDLAARARVIADQARETRVLPPAGPQEIPRRERDWWRVIRPDGIRIDLLVRPAMTQEEVITRFYPERRHCVIAPDADF